MRGLRIGSGRAGKGLIGSRRGSFAVFAVMAFASMLIITGAALKSAENMAIGSAVKVFGRLWGQSILGEYDVFLKERYGLMAFYGDEVSVGNKLNTYAEHTFAPKKYITAERAKCSLKGRALTEPENLKDQIEKAAAGSLMGKREGSGSDTGLEKEKTDENGGRGRYINNQGILKSLPSYGKTEKFYAASLVNKIKAGVGLNNVGSALAIDRYIFTFFKDYKDGKGLSDTYFDCEIEYIISGKADDVRAREDVRSKIRNLRNLLNLTYLYTCPEKRDSALALANVISPGPMAVLTQAVILESWAFAEAENDLKILYDDKTVPLLKNDSNWALSLENVFDVQKSNDDGKLAEEKPQKGYVLPEEIRGKNYQEYLRVLLCGMTEKTKLLRIMDLIQINMKYTYCGYFLLSDYNTGLAFDLEVSGTEHEFEEHY